MKPQDRFTLTEQERNSPLWLRLKAFYEKRLVTLRSKNDGPLGVDETLQLRGRIHEVKSFISLDEVMVVPPRKSS